MGFVYPQFGANWRAKTVILSMRAHRVEQGRALLCLSRSHARVCTGIGVGLSVFAVLTAVFILFPRENTEPTAAEQAVPASVSDWGLSFQTEGQPPVGNVSAEELRQYNAFYVGDTSRKIIYLTFDAGYENGCTPAILDALKSMTHPPASFVVGNFIDTAPELVKRMAAEGGISWATIRCTIRICPALRIRARLRRN